MLSSGTLRHGSDLHRRAGPQLFLHDWWVIHPRPAGAGRLGCDRGHTRRSRAPSLRRCPGRRTRARHRCRQLGGWRERSVARGRLLAGLPRASADHGRAGSECRRRPVRRRGHIRVGRARCIGRSSARTRSSARSWCPCPAGAGGSTSAARRRGSKHWWIEAMDAPTPRELPVGRRTVVLPGTDLVAVKDPVITVDDAGWRMWVCCHPLDVAGAEDRMWTAVPRAPTVWTGRGARRAATDTGYVGRAGCSRHGGAAGPSR